MPSEATRAVAMAATLSFTERFMFFFSRGEKGWLGRTAQAWRITGQIRKGWKSRIWNDPPTNATFSKRFHAAQECVNYCHNQVAKSPSEPPAKSSRDVRPPDTASSVSSPRTPWAPRIGCGGPVTFRDYCDGTEWV
jgi:hypothetical protein